MNTKQTFIIEGLAGKKSLKGSIEVKGAKNAALKAMAASVLFDGPVRLENIPDTDDIVTMASILTKLGAKISKPDRNVLVIDASALESTDIDPDLARTMRASIVLTGPMLSRFNRVSFPAPGGCVIGTRPVDQFLEGYRKMGASTASKKDIFLIEANDLHDSEIFFDFQTVGGTETLMMAAVLTKGRTVLKNCALEPEIVSIAKWLNSCGADIRGAGTSTMEIYGTGGRLLRPETYRTLPDRIEAGSFLILGALCAGDLLIKNCNPGNLESVINLLKNAGADMEVGESSIRVKAADHLKSFNVRTHEYPGFPTDLQSPMVTLLTQADGQSVVLETIFEGRFKFVEDLAKMGADITIMNPREVLIKGPTPLGKLPDDEELTAHDIRAGFALVMAAVVGKGRFIVNNVHLIDRGYEKLEERLTAIGVSIRRNGLKG